MPKFEFELGVAACCGSAIVVEVSGGNLYPHCTCHRVEIENWLTDVNGPSLRCIYDPSRARRIKLSPGIVQQGLIWREVWRHERGRIFRNLGRRDFLVSIDAEGGRQVMCGSFEQAFCLLAGRPWEADASS